MAAKQCLLNAKRRSEYDAALRAEMAKSPPTRLSPGAPAESKPARLLADSEEAAASLSDESWQLAPPQTAPERPTEWVVGSGSGASIRLRGRWVSRAHCRLWESDGVTWIEDLGSTNGTYVNEVAVSAPVELREGDLVTLGRRTRLPWPLPAQLAGRDLRAYLIGRDPECDYAIDDRSVSQHHAQLLIESGRAMLQDLGSLNGTRVGSLDQFLAGGEWWELPGHVSVYFGSHKVFAQDLLGRVGGA
jgi:pSer/pThr/pTyr-binding forkhead associated (FHA) protein